MNLATRYPEIAHCYTLVKVEPFTFDAPTSLVADVAQAALIVLRFGPECPVTSSRHTLAMHADVGCIRAASAQTEIVGANKNSFVSLQTSFHR